MSHSWEYDDPEVKDNYYVFIGNSDLSGNIIIRRIDRWKDEVLLDIEIPGSVLIDFVADHVRMERISKLEQMDTNELLGIRS